MRTKNLTFARVTKRSNAITATLNKKSTIRKLRSKGCLCHGAHSKTKRRCVRRGSSNRSVSAKIGISRRGSRASQVRTAKPYALPPPLIPSRRQFGSGASVSFKKQAYSLRTFISGVHDVCGNLSTRNPARYPHSGRYLLLTFGHRFSRSQRRRCDGVY